MATAWDTEYFCVYLSSSYPFLLDETTMIAFKQWNKSPISVRHCSFRLFLINRLTPTHILRISKFVSHFTSELHRTLLLKDTWNLNTARFAETQTYWLETSHRFINMSSCNFIDQRFPIICFILHLHSMNVVNGLWSHKKHNLQCSSNCTFNVISRHCEKPSKQNAKAATENNKSMIFEYHLRKPNLHVSSLLLERNCSSVANNSAWTIILCSCSLQTPTFWVCLHAKCKLHL